MIRLDHILWAAPDFEEGERLFERLTRIWPARGDVHPGFGMRNSLAALDSGAYYEILAPDPGQDLTGNRGGHRGAEASGLLTLAVATYELDALKAIALRGPAQSQRPRGAASRPAEGRSA